MAYLNRGIFGHDYGSTLWPTSTWYPVYVHPSGCVEICGTVTTGSITASIEGTLDVDIKTLGGSVVPAGPLPVDIFNWYAVSTLDVDIKTLGGSVVPAGPLPVDIEGTLTTTMGGTMDVDIKTLGGSVVPAGPLPVDVENQVDVSVTGTVDTDLKTLGGSLVPAGPLPVDVMSGIFAGTQDVDIKTVGGSLLPSGNLPVDVENIVDVDVTGTADVDIKTLGGSLVPAGPLPVDIISGGVTGTQDVDIKTIGGSVVASGPLPVDIISGGFTGTSDVDIKTVGGSVIPSGNLPINNYVTDSTNWYGWRAAESWSGGTESTPTTYAVPDVAIVGRYVSDAIGTLQAIIVDAQGRLQVTNSNLYTDADSKTNLSYASNPMGAALYTYNNVSGDWDRGRSAESMVSSTIDDQGLLAIAEFGYDGSAWRYKAVNSSGYTIVTGTVDTGIAGTLDVDIKTIGGSVVASGPLPTTAQFTGTMDTDLKTLGGSLVPSIGGLGVYYFLPVSHRTKTVSPLIDGEADSVYYMRSEDGTAVKPQNISQNFGYNHVSGDWDRLRTTESLAGGTITTGLLADGGFVEDGSGNWYSLKDTEAVAGGTLTHGNLATDHVVRRTSTVLLNNVKLGATMTHDSSDWNVTDFNKLGLMITLTSSGAPTDCRIIAQFKDWTGTYYDYMNDFWGDMRWEDTVCASGINECVMGDLPVGTLRIRAISTGSDANKFFMLTVKGQVYTW